MNIEFNDAAADAVIHALTSAESTLRGQSGERSTAAEIAMVNFAGAYSKAFALTRTAELEDRLRLAGVLEDLTLAIREAKRRAENERRRLQETAEWQAREDQRQAERAADLTGAAYDSAAALDPKPSEYAIAPPEISGAFAPGVRERSARRGGRGGRSSADPLRLRTFAARSRSLDARLEQHIVAVQNAWASFVASCSWLRFGTMSFVSGFPRMVSENTADATWIGRIADQFARAGGGSLSDARLDLLARATALDVAESARFKQLLDGALSPAEAAEYWNSLGLSPADVRLLPPEALLALASLSGLPAWAKDAASREFLEYALENPKIAYELMGFTDPLRTANSRHPSLNGAADGFANVSYSEFVSQLKAINDALGEADEDAKGAPGHPVVQLVGLGSHDGALVAGISLGNLDVASNVGVLASGMGSDVGDMFNGNKAAQALYEDAFRKSDTDSFAVVNWIGYRSPKTVGQVRDLGHADSGARELASFLNGISASRGEYGNPSEQLAVFAHSYGSTVAVQALKQTSFEVGALVTLGSAGVADGTTAGQINATQKYAVHASGDNLAWMGKGGGKGLDPRDIAGFDTLSAEPSEGPGGVPLKATTMHNLYVEEDSWSPLNLSGTVGYLSVGSTALSESGAVLAGTMEK
ncbi:alpha/beta hydrolase [Leucobacter sp. NPDC015123]|uniref:alpha/beta hydrolase n=1 Tax=Leucobacter sp. NPDC015123 TaxID=3364129 RepID=UPI0036F4AA85